jgi:hypothetical protein
MSPHLSEKGKAMLNLHDPSQTWDSNNARLDAVESKRSHFVELAKALRDDAAIELASSTLASFRRARSDYRTARAEYDANLSALHEADRTHEAALRADQIGTQDRKKALQNRDDVIAAEATVRYLANTHQEFTQAVNARSQRMIDAANGIDTIVAGLTDDYATRLFQFKDPSVAITKAQQDGKEANAQTAAWWRVCEASTRQQFEARLARERSEFENNRPRDVFGRFSERDAFDGPTVDALESCFAARRNAFAQAKRKAESTLADMSGQIAATFGGAK